jgi:hypothetical protein
VKSSLCVAVLVLAACSGSGSSSSGPLSADEREPLDKTAAGAVLNDTAATAERIRPGVPLFGALADGTDVDFYAFAARADEILTADLIAVRLDADAWSQAPAITLYGTDGTTVLWRNDPVIMDWDGEDPGLPGVAIPASGTYYVSVSATQTSDTVGPYAVRLALAAPDGALQQEAEAADETGVNNTIDTGQAIVPGLVEGTTIDGDDDYYTFSLTTTQRVVFTLTSFRDGSAGGTSEYFDTELYLYNAEGTQLHYNDDTYYYDSALDSTLEPGDYAVRVTKCCGEPDTVPYLLEFDRRAVSPTADAGTNTTSDAAMLISYGHTYAGTFTAFGESRYYRFTGAAGDVIRFDVLTDDNLSGDPVVLTDPDGAPVAVGRQYDASTYLATVLQKSGEYTLSAVSASEGDFRFGLDRVAAARFEAEPNDAAGAESSFGSTGWAAGALGGAEDVDRFTFEAQAKQLVTVALLGEGRASDEWELGATQDHFLITVYDAEGTPVVQAGKDMDPLPAGIIRPESTIEASFRAPAKGTYTVVVSFPAGPTLGSAPHYALRLYRNK